VLIERVDAAFDATRTPFQGLVAQGVREPLHRLSRRDRVPVQVQITVNLDERHRSVVAGEDCERGRAQVFALEWVCVGGDGRNGRRPGPTSDPERVLEMLAVDARPHGHAQLDELGPDLGELFGEDSLCGVELSGPIKEQVALGVERRERIRPVRQGPVPDPRRNRRHHELPRRNGFRRKDRARSATASP
jgi:hypothetical protein